MDNFQTFRDGDIILTQENFIFYAFGYEHPPNKVISYIKYFPKEVQAKFRLAWIDFEWNLDDLKYVRPKQLYSPKIFKEIQKVFKENYPDYLFRDPYIGKTVFVVPIERIQKVFVPEMQLQELLQKSTPTSLEREAIDIIHLLSTRSEVPVTDFGIHGSLATGMSTEKSDIDLAIYGGGNYLKVKKVVFQLFKENKLEYFNEIQSDEYRMNKYIYKGRKFVFNAIRKEEELRREYGRFRYSSIRPLHFYCDIVDSKESMFRPAIYHIEEYFAADDKSIITKTHRPSQIVSMIGEYRDIARKGDEVEVKGMLERVEKMDNKEEYYRVVIGSGSGEEFMWPV